MIDKVMGPVEPIERICPRCQRPYFLEPVNDPGVCCICHRDDQMRGLYGTDWRKHIKKAMLAAAPTARRAGKRRVNQRPVTHQTTRRSNVIDRRATAPNAEKEKT